MFAALLVVAGRLFDRYGHRPGFLIGIVVFTASSALCAASDDVGWLVGGRVVQAVGAAVLLPTSLALLLTAAVGLLALGLVEGNNWGWTSSGVLGSLAATPVLLVLFLAQSARHRTPVVELPMLRIIPFSAASVATLLFAVTFRRHDPLRLAVVPERVALLGAADRSCLGSGAADGSAHGRARRAGRPAHGQRRGGGPGNLLFGVGLLYWALRTGITEGYAAGMLPGFLIGGVGVGLALPTMTAAGATALPPERLATGTGVLTMARQIGAVIGVAVIVVIIGTPHSLATVPGAFRHGWYGMAAAGALAAIASLVIPRHSAAPRVASPQPRAPTSVATSATVDGTGRT